jgi:hypothetical protein
MVLSYLLGAVFLQESGIRNQEFLGFLIFAAGVINPEDYPVTGMTGLRAPEFFPDFFRVGEPSGNPSGRTIQILCKSSPSGCQSGSPTRQKSFKRLIHLRASITCIAIVGTICTDECR